MRREGGEDLHDSNLTTTQRYLGKVSDAEAKRSIESLCS